MAGLRLSDTTGTPTEDFGSLMEVPFHGSCVGLFL